MSDNYPILPTGAWTDPDERRHKFDEGLAKALCGFFDPKEVFPFWKIVDLGCGPGRYVGELHYHYGTGGTGPMICGFDGNPAPFTDIVGLAAADLVKHPGLCVGTDWILCLEVGEHVPAEHEDKIFAHLSRAGIGVIMSWATPGQGGHGHVNCKPPGHIGARMTKMGFVEAPSEYFRRCSTLDWFVRNLRVFVRPEHSDWVADRLRSLDNPLDR